MDATRNEDPGVELDHQAVQAVLEQVERSKEDLVEFLRRLLAFRTESQNPAASHFLSEADACRDFLSDHLLADGFELDQWDAQPASFSRHPIVAGRLAGAGGGRSIALNGHFDVVPAAEGSWSHDPWGGEIVDGRLYGRGAVDMKGGLAAMLWATRCVREAGVHLAGDVWAHLVSDEEVVGFGTRECVARLPAVDAVIVPEPSGMALAPVSGGLEHFRIEVDGLAAHAAVRYRSIYAGGKHGGGANAIEKMVIILTALQDLEREWGVRRSYPLLPEGFNTLLPGVIVGGTGGGHDGQLNMLTNPGTTPDYCSLEYNAWYYPDERIVDVRREIEQFVAALCRTDPWLSEHPPRFTWALRGISFPPAATDVGHPIVTTMSEALRAAGVPVKFEGLKGVCDLSWYQAQGMPGLVFAPGSINVAHAPDEFVEVEALVDATKALAVTLVGWCGGA